MMKMIDDKLRDILFRFYEYNRGWLGGVDNYAQDELGYIEAIARLKQVFAEEEMKRYGEPISEQELSEIKITNLKEIETMTGQEWLSRYNEQKHAGSLDNLKDLPHTKDYSDGIDHAVIKCDEAAERASGLEKEL